MNITKALSQKTDEQLRVIYRHFVGELSAKCGDAISEINKAYLEDWEYAFKTGNNLGQRKGVFICGLLLDDLSRQYSTLHVQVSPETQEWSYMEDTRFFTTDEKGKQEFEKRFLGYA